eukprot:SAG31_NODE_1621_length_7724_cov_3.297049_6_plen_85_part_00
MCAGVITSSTAANAVHSIEGLDSLLFKTAQIAVAALFSFQNALTYHDDAVSNMLYAALVFRFIIPLHAAVTRLVSAASPCWGLK